MKNIIHIFLSVCLVRCPKRKYNLLLHLIKQLKYTTLKAVDDVHCAEINSYKTKLSELIQGPRRQLQFLDICENKLYQSGDYTNMEYKIIKRYSWKPNNQLFGKQ